MAVSAFQVYDSFKTEKERGLIDMDGHTIKAALVTSSYTPADSDDGWAAISANEVSNTGYTAGGVTCTISITEPVAGTTRVDSTTNPSWTAGTTDIVAKYLVFYDDTHASKQLIGYYDLNSGGGSVTATAGNPLTVNIHANGLYESSGG